MVDCSDLHTDIFPNGELSGGVPVRVVGNSDYWNSVLDRSVLDHLRHGELTDFLALKPIVSQSLFAAFYAELVWNSCWLKRAARR